MVWAAAPKPLQANYFKQGCGTDRQGTYYSPVVGDDGSLAVIAPYHEETYDPNHPQRCGYWISANGKTVTQMYAAGAEFMGIVFFRALDNLSADVARKNFWGASYHFTGGSNIDPYIHHFGLAIAQESEENTQIAYSDGFHLRLQPNAEGTTAFLHAVNDSDDPLTATGIYALDGPLLTLRQAIILPHDLGFAPAYTADGSAIFYIGENVATSTETQKMLALYRSDIVDGTVEWLEDIGPRTSLKVYESKYLKTTPMVVANADGTVIAYRWANGSTTVDGGVQLRVATYNAMTGNYTFGFASRLTSTEETLLVDSTEGGNTVDCQYPAISADGRFIAFTARATNAPGGASYRRAWRYDRQELRLECLSAELASNCQATALSPNGRYAVFVALDTSTQLPQVYRVDGDPAIGLESKQLLVCPGQSIDLELTAVAASEATIAVAGEIPGQLYTIDGDDVLPGNSYSLDTLPWSFTAAGQTGSSTITITLTEGTKSASTELSLIISDFANLTSPLLAKNTRDSYDYTNLHFSANGKSAVFLTDAPLSEKDDAHFQDVYRMTFATGKVELLTGDAAFSANVYAPQLSGDGNTVYWTDQDGAFWSSDGVKLVDSGVDKYVSPAVSYDGKVIVIRREEQLWRSIDGGASFAPLAVEGATQTADYHSPMLSYDGGVLAFTMEDGGVQALYVLDGAEELRHLADDIIALHGITQDGGQALVQQQDGSFAWIAVGNGKVTAIPALPQNARDISLAGNGRFVAYVAPSAEAITQSGIWLCDLGKGVTTEITAGADGASFAPALSASGKQLLFSSDATNLIDGFEDANEERDLFLYTYPGWKNVLPGAPIYTAHSLQEDPPQPVLLRLGLQDKDGDALVPVMTASATLGTARLVPPCEGQLDYRLSYLPPQDFCGTDSVQIRAWDGTGWGASNNLKLVVQNVNDTPIWDDDTPDTLALAAGDSLLVTLHATDVDEANPEPDVLNYSLDETSPAWATLDATSGVLTLRPGFRDTGEFMLNAVVSDGIVRVAHSIKVTVSDPGEYEIPLALLRDDGATPPDPESALGQWLTGFAGCWISLGNGWQALSLPGDVDIAELCAVLGCEQIWLYSTGMYVAVAEGTLPAGTGFWARVVWPDDVTGISLFLTPVLQRIGDLPRFCGPLVGEEPLAGLRGVDGGAWVDCPNWQPGRGYFIR